MAENLAQTAVGLRHVPAAASDVRRTAGGAVLAVSSGVLAYLAGPPLEWWPLIFVAFVPMVWAQHRLVPAWFAPVVPAIAIGTFLITQITPGLIQGDVAWYYHGYPLFVAALIVLLGWPGRHFHARTRYRWLSVSFPLAWVAIDAARVFSGHETLGGTWGMSVYALYGQPWLLQPLSIVGIFGLQLLVLMQNFALAHLLIAWLDRRAPAAFEHPPAAWRSAVASVAVIVALSGLWVVVSLLQYKQAPTSPGDLRVATVQANTKADVDVELQRLMDGTKEAAARGAQITVWREGALDFDPQRERADEFRALAAETGNYIAIGYSFTQEDGVRRNEAVVVAPDGTFFGPYGKDHPGRFAGDHSDTGGVYKVYKTTLGHIATIICYDLDFTDTAREMVRHGAEFIAVPSHDPPALARTHYTHLVFRAIENRVPMAKADAMADSAIIDAYGRIVELVVHPFSARQAREVSDAMSLPTEVLVANVARRDQTTFYTRTGDWAGWLAILGALAIYGTHVIRVIRGRSRQ